MSGAGMGSMGLSKLEPRERRLLALLLGLLGAIVLLVLPFLLWRALETKRTSNQELRDLIDTVVESRARIAARKSKHEALLARYAKPAPPLAGFIEAQAQSHGISVPESQDRPDLPHGKRYTERSTVVKLHKVGMLALARTLEGIERSGHPVSISRLSIKPRAGEKDAFEVELGVSAFDRKPDAPAAASDKGEKTEKSDKAEKEAP